MRNAKARKSLSDKPPQVVDIARRTVFTPLGPVTIAASDDGVTGLVFGGRQTSGRGALAAAEKSRAARHLDAALRWLDAYLEVRPGRRAPGSIPRLAPVGTDFQKRVWRALTEISSGETRRYGEIARRIGKPKASRAVGAACGANPIALLVPCHRVVAGNGGLGGFSAGLARKRWLLAHERNPAEAIAVRS